MHRWVCMYTVSLMLAVSASADVQKSTSGERSDVSVTIYNENLGLVREIRRITLPKGTVSVWFEDVATGIDPTSVKVEVLKGLRGLELLEQNYEYDLLSPNKLMEKYVGSSVELVVKHPQTGEESTVSAVLLSMNGGPVYRIGDKIHIGHPGRVVLPGIPENLIARPTLVWLLNGTGGGGEIEVSYLTSGMSWKADYVALLSANDALMDVTGWVTLTNDCGAGFEEAKLKLIAGTIQRAPQKLPLQRMAMEESAVAFGKKAEFEEESFFEYHLYSLPRRTTIKDSQTKQIELLRAGNVVLKKEFVITGSMYRHISTLRLGKTRKEHPVVTVRFENTESNNIGTPLPAGIFRFYKKDSEGIPQLVGEDAIDHVPVGEEVSLRVGEAFDIVFEREITDYDVISKGEVYEFSYEATIRNSKTEDVDVKVVEQLQGDWQILTSSHEPHRESAYAVSFTVRVPKEGKTVLTLRARVRLL